MKQYIHAIYCAPTGAWKDGEYPSRLTDEVFAALANAGINRVIGNVYDGKKETQRRTAELCDKYNIQYLPSPKSAREYTCVTVGPDGERPYAELTDAEKKDLDRRFVEDVEELSKLPAFAGIFLEDEAGYLAFDGIAHAKQLFDAYFPQYEFHNNFYSYTINEDAFWGGMWGKACNDLPFALEGELEIIFENRFNYYDKLVEGLLSKAPFEFISQDKYPFETFCPEIPTSVHVGLFELNAYFNRKKQKYGCKFYNYMQLGEFTDCDDRRMNYAEMALQMHVTAAYGSDGFAYFPGCYPWDFMGHEKIDRAAHGGSSLIDMDGKTTIFYAWLQRLNGFFKKIEDDILSSQHLGVKAYGQYKNGFDTSLVEQVQFGECIFVGELPDILSYDSGISVSCENEIMVSTFEREGKKRYYVVNLSTVYDNWAEIELPDGSYEMIAQECSCSIEKKTTITLEAGCGVYIMEKRDFI